MLKPGDIIVSQTGTRFKRDYGHFVAIPENAPKLLLNQRLLAVTCHSFIDSRYVVLASKLKPYQDYFFSNETGGVNQGNVGVAGVMKGPIPLPPLNEQKQIVAAIASLRERSQKARSAVSAIPELCDKFRQSVLAAAFRGDLTVDWREQNPDVEPASVLLERIRQEKNEFEKVRKSSKRPNVSQQNIIELPESWELVLSHDVFYFVTSGSRGWAQYYSNSGAIFIRVGNLDRHTISLDFESTQRVQPPIGAEGTRTRVYPKDILISITADIGMIALAHEDITEAYINQHIALARPVKNLYAPYLAWYLASSEGGFKQFQQLQRGATKVGLGLDDIQSVWIPFPSLHEQKEIVRQIESCFKAIDCIKQQYEEANDHLDWLDRSILAKAFRGELVEQDPNDEPASVLLERIRAEREQTQGKVKKPGKKGQRTIKTE